MSTIDKLIHARVVKAVDFGLLEDEVAERGLFGTERLFNFLQNELPGIPSRDAQLSSSEQVAVLFGRYLTNERLILQSAVSPLRHLSNAIWEFKTLDVRVFGWAVRRDCFVIDSGCDTKRLKGGELNYSGFIIQTEWVRKKLGFKAGDYVEGTGPNDILKKFTIIARS
jgi:hypothetical protein